VSAIARADLSAAFAVLERFVNAREPRHMVQALRVLGPFRKKGKGPAKLIRMTPTERRKRKLGARRGKIKRRAKAARIRQKMTRVRLKRKSLGLGKANKTY
jgi:hypothetical protein